jgi:threonine/homoserine/homoserine lactone efflux protein
MVHVLAAAVGLSLIVAQSAVAFNLVKYIGAAYLIYLGIRLLLRKEHALAIGSVTSQGVRRALFEGIAVEALNVKTALFFLAFLPQFVSSAEPLVPQLVLLGTICVALNTLVDVVAVFAADRLLKSSTARAARARFLTRASGITMVGLGAYLALARRGT